MGKQRAHRVDNNVIDGEARILDAEGQEEGTMNNKENQGNKAPETPTPAEQPKGLFAWVGNAWRRSPKWFKTGAKVVGGALLVGGIGYAGYRILGGNSDDSNSDTFDPIGLPFDEPDDTVSFDDFSVEEKPESETENVEE